MSEDRDERHETPEDELIESATEAMEEALGFKCERPLPTFPISKKIPKKLADLVQR